jgi:membrane-associated phospholipid phosphatase
MDTARIHADMPAPRPAPKADRSAGTVLDPRPGGLAERLGTRWRERSPVLVGSAIALLGLVVLTGVIVGIGLLLTKVFAGGSLESWDTSVNEWFVSRRTPTLNTVTRLGSDLGATFTIIAIAVLVAVVLGIKRFWREVELIVVALTIEVSVFLLATLVVDRARPDVPRLDVSPPTSSYPSGHTAAAIALYVGLAIVVSSLTGNRFARVLAWTLALLLPIAVGLSRLYRGMHHPTDVLASVVLGAGALTIALLAARTTPAQILSRAPDEEPR